ncbi:NAD-dependent epimerase/dehydratase family protein [Amylibacter sp.]|nr:NAD-dependent epimerase/dehydratase family protein [Amylibacter sp.]MDB2393914.1 NAD-dependent epimerase/dehydratase family protein [bacterium]
MTKIYLAGVNGLLGSSIKESLSQTNFNYVTSSRSELDLCDEIAVFNFFDRERPTHTIFSAAKTGGIFSNQNSPLEFIEDNLKMQFNVFRASEKFGCKAVTFIASSTIYPESATQPFDEGSLFSGKLHDSIASYGYAKLIGIHTATVYNNKYNMDIRCVIPTNLYGSGDKFDGDNKHVIPALIDKFLTAKEMNKSTVSLHGTGKARREFLYSDDAAEFIVNVNLNLSKEKWRSVCDPKTYSINLGATEDITIANLAKKIASLVGYGGDILFDIDTNDGVVSKKVSIRKIQQLGWMPKTLLDIGLNKTIQNRLRSKEN